MTLISDQGQGGPGAGAEADIDITSQNHFPRSVQSCSWGVTIRGDQAAPFAALSGWMGYHMGRSGQACSPLNTRNSCKYLFSRVQVAAGPGHNGGAAGHLSESSHAAPGHGGSWHSELDRSPPSRTHKHGDSDWSSRDKQPTVSCLRHSAHNIATIITTLTTF